MAECDLNALHRNIINRSASRSIRKLRLCQASRCFKVFSVLSLSLCVNLWFIQKMNVSISLCEDLVGFFVVRSSHLLLKVYWFDKFDLVERALWFTAHSSRQFILTRSGWSYLVNINASWRYDGVPCNQPPSPQVAGNILVFKFRCFYSVNPSQSALLGNDCVLRSLSR